MLTIKRSLHSILIIILAVNIFGCSKDQVATSLPQAPSKNQNEVTQLQTDETEQLVISPDDMNRPIVEAINKAHDKIDLANFHLSNRDVVKALITAAKDKNVKIRIILDNGTLSKSKTAQNIVDQLKTSGIEVKPSSKFFSITHQKSFVIDDNLALISTINLVTTFATTRDFGLFTHNKDIIAEVNSVFQADWENADDNGGLTPDLHQKRLLWSPINSLDKLKDLILSAKQNIKLMVENLGDKEIDDALIAKAKEGVSIQVFTPGCVSGGGLRNRPFIKELSDNNIANKVASPNADSEHPYLHAKMILVDNKTFYLGSENFSYNSLLKARELGIITTDEGKSKKISDVFDHDWNNGLAPEAVTKEDCDKAKM